MIAVRDLRGRPFDLADVVPRAELNIDAALAKVQPIIDAVRARGVAALDEYAEAFDGVRPPALRVPADVVRTALADLDPDVRTALTESIRRARLVHRDQRREEHTTVLGDGARVVERWLPVARVGLYVPGGRAVYPSSVVMNVVAAQEAGVPSLAIASPPQAENGGGAAPTR
ncbi:MAG: histidinol dehydrogenase, partial [Propionibacterium sp.]|nr:histidinol dehydrogenase [Propionibacterium sp.]